MDTKQNTPLQAAPAGEALQGVWKQRGSPIVVTPVGRKEIRKPLQGAPTRQPGPLQAAAALIQPQPESLQTAAEPVQPQPELEQVQPKLEQVQPELEQVQPQPRALQTALEQPQPGPPQQMSEEDALALSSLEEERADMRQIDIIFLRPGAYFPEEFFDADVYPEFLPLTIYEPLPDALLSEEALLLEQQILPEEQALLVAEAERSALPGAEPPASRESERAAPAEAAESAAPAPREGFRASAANPPPAQPLPYRTPEPNPAQGAGAQGQVSAQAEDPFPALIRREVLAWQYYRKLAWSAERDLAELFEKMATDCWSCAKRLASAYFLSSGRRYWPSRGEEPQLPPYLSALRERFHVELQDEALYRSAAERCTEEYLCDILMDGADLSRRHARQLQLLVEAL